MGRTGREYDKKQEEEWVKQKIELRGKMEWRKEIDDKSSLIYYKEKDRFGMIDGYNGSRGGHEEANFCFRPGRVVYVLRIG